MHRITGNPADIIKLKWRVCSINYYGCTYLAGFTESQQPKPPAFSTNPLLSLKTPLLSLKSAILSKLQVTTKTYEAAT